MCDESRMKASLISGIMEVGVTHPLDYIKTILQSKSGTVNGNKFHTLGLLKTPYKGISSKLAGTVPMRILFWCSLDYFNSNGFSPVSSAFLTSVLQTVIDYPIEQIKTQRMVNNKKFYNSFENINFKLAILPHLLRNIGFTISVYSIIQFDQNSTYHAGIGGFIGSILTQPLDNLKTWYQSGNINYPKHWKLNNYMVGWNYRASVSLLSMNIGWITFNKVKCFLEVK